DLVVLGGGTAGYVAAIKASQLGLKTAVVEKSRLGGTCLHKGCIPTKSMLKSAEVVNTMRNAEDYGIESYIPDVSMEKIQARKNEVVDRMHSGINQLMKKNKIDVFKAMDVYWDLPSSLPWRVQSLLRTLKMKKRKVKSSSTRMY